MPCERVVELRASKKKHKKYQALVRGGPGGDRVLHFGDRRYEHYRDATPLRLFASKDHLDPARRQRFLLRHGGSRLKSEAIRNRRGRLITSRYLAIKYLW